MVAIRVIDTIEFRGIRFHYKPEEPILENFDLTVRKGESIALVGPTGGGKSTIVNLAARFYEPNEGQVLINGVDFRERSLQWWQAQFGIVQQVPHLFSGTIMENIRYGRLEADDLDVLDAARQAGAHDFIERLDDGYEHDVGEGGELLSTGQRQLISLARALLADPQIFVMDEATSSIDTETETLIQEAIDRVMTGRSEFRDRASTFDDQRCRPDHLHRSRQDSRRRDPRRPDAREWPVCRTLCRTVHGRLSTLPPPSIIRFGAIDRVATSEIANSPEDQDRGDVGTIDGAVTVDVAHHGRTTEAPVVQENGEVSTVDLTIEVDVAGAVAGIRNAIAVGVL